MKGRLVLLLAFVLAPVIFVFWVLEAMCAPETNPEGEFRQLWVGFALLAISIVELIVVLAALQLLGLAQVF